MPRNNRDYKSCCQWYYTESLFSNPVDLKIVLILLLLSSSIRRSGVAGQSGLCMQLRSKEYAEIGLDS